MKSRLTHHAKLRLAERTTMTEDAFFQLIDSLRYVVVGIEPYTNTLHKLIYSEQDRDHFVTIQNMATGEVITILPLHYHKNLEWKITEKKLRQAVFRAAPRIHDSLYYQNDKLEKEGVKCSVALVLATLGLKSKKRTFGSYRFAELPETAEDALCDPGFVEKITTRLRDLNVSIDEVEEILLSDTEGNLVLKLPWESLDCFDYDLVEKNHDLTATLSPPIHG